MEKKKIVILALSALLVVMIICVGIFASMDSKNKELDAVQTDPIVETQADSVSDPTQMEIETIGPKETEVVSDQETEAVGDLENEALDDAANVESEVSDGSENETTGTNQDNTLNEDVISNGNDESVGEIKERIVVVGELEPNAEMDCPDDGYVVYTTHWVNVRSKPSMNGEIVGKIEEGTRVFRYSTADGWSKIYYDHGIGYIVNKYIDAAKVEQVDVYSDVDETVYSGHDVNIRLAPSTKAPSIGKLKQGDSIRRIAVGKNGWSQVIYKNQLYYINSQYLSVDSDYVMPLEMFLEQEIKDDVTTDGETTENVPNETESDDATVGNDNVPSESELTTGVTEPKTETETVNSSTTGSEE